MESKQTRLALSLMALCCALFAASCGKDTEIEMPAETVELDEPIIYATVNLRISHIMTLGIGSIESETVVPLRFPIMQGEKNIDKGEMRGSKETESEWNLAGEGMLEGVTSFINVPVTYDVKGYFENCGLKLDVTELLKYSEVKSFDNVVLGELAVDLGEDEVNFYLGQFIPLSNPEKIIDDSLGPTVTDTLYLKLEDVSVPPEIRLICGVEQ